jgi:hypothetical protein
MWHQIISKIIQALVTLFLSKRDYIKVVKKNPKDFNTINEHLFIEQQL